MKKLKEFIMPLAVVMALSALAVAGRPHSLKRVHPANTAPEEQVDIMDEDVPLADISELDVEPKEVGEPDSEQVDIDLSELDDSLFYLRWKKGEVTGAKVLVKTPDGTTYAHAMRIDGKWQKYRLSGGKGRYYIGVYARNHSEIYSTALSAFVDVK